MIGWLRRGGKEAHVSAAGSAEAACGLPFRTDLHAHLIPGIDDGSPDMATSLELLEGLRELGYRRVVLTPHVMADSYRNSTERILEGRDRLREAAAERGLELEIYAAAEYYLDEEMMRRLDAGDLLCIGEERFVLFETSYYNEPLALEERIYELTGRGYRPLLAHPERYRYVRDPEGFYGNLRRMGVALQVNINSLGGCYGDDARRKAHWLAERGWIDFLGSDLHGRKHLECLRATVGSEIFARYTAGNLLLNDTLRFGESI